MERDVDELAGTNRCRETATVAIKPALVRI
jgi:hypothetical protein